MKISISTLTQMIKTQQGSLAIKLNGLSNHNQNTKTQRAGVLLQSITLLLWLPRSPSTEDSQAQEAGVKASTTYDPQLSRTAGASDKSFAQPDFSPP